MDRIRFQVDSQQVNFRRAVTVADATGRYESGGEITRVRLNRAGTTVVSEEMDLGTIDRTYDSNSTTNSGKPSRQVVITIDNGDNPPLAITAVKLSSIERRVYFEPQGKSSLKLYYGDSKLDSPIYDYGRFFHADLLAVRADLGPGEHNAAYRGRPDERPWSERHNAVLWAAMLLAVAVLAALAIRGLKTKAGTLSS